MAFTPIRSGLANLLAGWKFLLSFRKREWSFEDYPVVVRKLRDSGEHWGEPAQWTLPTYDARIVRWPIRGTGNSPAEAINSLRKSFDFACNRSPAVPRPGRRLPVEFASQSRIAVHSDLAQEFIHLILGIGPAWISDESSLWDFTLGSSLDEYFEKIRSLYGVDVSDIDNGSIASILERIAASRRIHGRTTYELIA